MIIKRICVGKKYVITCWSYRLVYKTFYCFICTYKYEDGNMLEMKFWQSIMKETRIDKIPNQDTIQDLKVQSNCGVLLLLSLSQ
jgi:hypothetical protein